MVFSSVVYFYTQPNNKGRITMFDFITFKIHWPNDACFKPCLTKTVIDKSAEIQYPPLTYFIFN